MKKHKFSRVSDQCQQSTHADNRMQKRMTTQQWVYSSICMFVKKSKHQHAGNAQNVSSTNLHNQL